MKKLIPLIMLGFGVALAIVIGQRMSTDAMAVVIGVAVGVAASVPTSLLLIALLRKERSGFRQEEPPANWNPHQQPMLPPGGQPNVIVIDPSQYADTRYKAGYPLPPPTSSEQASLPGGVRRLTVVGGDDDWR